MTKEKLMKIVNKEFKEKLMKTADEELKEELKKHTCIIEYIIFDRATATEVLLSRKKCKRCIELEKHHMKTVYGIED